jgi:hypothetical protein
MQQPHAHVKMGGPPAPEENLVDRINHVKIATPDPRAVQRFLREVVDIPEGWPIGAAEALPLRPEPVVSGARDANGEFTPESVSAFRGTSELAGFIAGDTSSRQFQIIHAETPRIWGIAIGTRDFEGAYERAVERGIPCTPPDVVDWHDGDAIRFFFAEVGGVVFEVLRVEA